MRGVKQKPNEVCACGSGAKHKRCCGAAGASVAPPAGLSATDVRAQQSEVERLMREARAARDEANPARAVRRANVALALTGDVLCKRAAMTDVSSVADTVLRCLTFLLDAHVSAFSITAAQECHARALALLQPPHTFWARALTTHNHVSWRDTPLTVGGERDVRITLHAGKARQLTDRHLSKMHNAMGTLLAESRRYAEAAALYNSALAVIACEPLSVRRDANEAVVYEHLSMVCAHEGDAEGMRAHLQTALRILRPRAYDGVQDADIDALAVQREYVSNLLVHGVMTKTDIQGAGDTPGCSRAELLQAMENSWEHSTKDNSKDPLHIVEGAGDCHRALPVCDTRVEQRRWLLRALALPGADTMLKAAAMRGCRACGGSEQPLKSCAGCGRVAYCGGACQKADWRRHKRTCHTATDNAGDAALADAVCAVCSRPLLAGDPAADDASGSAADAALLEEQRVVLPRCRHLAHAACRTACGSCPCAAQRRKGGHVSCTPDGMRDMCALPGCGARSRDGGAKKLLRCGTCRAACFCGAARQREDWRRHKGACVPPPRDDDQAAGASGS
jgi:hypothetical protein